MWQLSSACGFNYEKKIRFLFFIIVIYDPISLLKLGWVGRLWAASYSPRLLRLHACPSPCPVVLLASSGTFWIRIVGGARKALREKNNVNEFWARERNPQDPGLKSSLGKLMIPFALTITLCIRVDYLCKHQEGCSISCSLMCVCVCVLRTIVNPVAYLPLFKVRFLIFKILILIYLFVSLQWVLVAARGI